MSKFINPFTDVGFKRIFGQELSKPQLLDFLNALLEGERRITDITFLDKEQAAMYDGDRSPIYDILCQTESGEKIIVEMQNREHPNFKERMLYYAAEALTRQGERGTEWAYDIKAVYLIAFTNFLISGYDGELRIDVRLKTDDGRLFTDRLRMICLQMPCFEKQVDDCNSQFERWIYVLKNMETLNRMPWAAKNSVFQRLAEIAEVSAMTREERAKYDSALKRYRDTLNSLQGAEAKGLAEGMAKGIAKGRAEGRADVARRMKQRGMTAEEIADITGLTAEEIQGL